MKHKAVFWLSVLDQFAHRSDLTREAINVRAPQRIAQEGSTRIAYDVISRRYHIGTLRVGQDLNILGQIPVLF